MITVVTGPPCAGKTTHVHDHRSGADLVIDFDALASALGYPGLWNGEHPATGAARIAWNAVVRSVLLNPDSYGDVWLIQSRPASWMRGNYTRAGARFVDLDPGRDACLTRAARRGPTAVDAVNAWYADTSTPSHSRSW